MESELYDLNDRRHPTAVDEHEEIPVVSGWQEIQQLLGIFSKYMADTAFFLQYNVNQMYCNRPYKKIEPSPNAITYFDIFLKPVQNCRFTFFRSKVHT